MPSTTSKSEPKKLMSLMRRRFRPERCAGWDSSFHIFFTDAAPVTVNVKDGALEILTGLRGRPRARIATDTKSLAGVLKDDLQFDLTLLRGDLNTDNMAETFKLVSIFAPNAFMEKTADSQLAKPAPTVLAGKAEAAAFLSEWAARVSRDPAVQCRAAGSGVKGSLAIRARKPDFILEFRFTAKGLKAACKTASSNFDLETDAEVIHKILSGAQNLMIGLNRKSIGGLRGAGSEAALDALLCLQPALSRIYRETAAEK